MKKINWETSKRDMNLIRSIAKRAVAIAAEIQVDLPLIEIEMDILACHANGCKLRLKELLAADNFNFNHDVFGIRKHINRDTAQLSNHFLPRFSA